jgi:hypothetical protein
MTQEIGQEFLEICFANRWRLATAETSSTSPSAKLAQDDTLTENVEPTYIPVCIKIRTRYAAFAYIFCVKGFGRAWEPFIKRVPIKQGFP